MDSIEHIEERTTDTIEVRHTVPITEECTRGHRHLRSRN